ncbi:hypothetical protein DITRI_Ditri10aG0177400 [Diplodiscus trichospermus]
MVNSQISSRAQCITIFELLEPKLDLKRDILANIGDVIAHVNIFNCCGSDEAEDSAIVARSSKIVDHYLALQP